MPQSKTLYVSDLDGTLLNHNAVISEHTKNELNKLISYGINFTVATGRTTDAATEIMSDIKLNIPIISFNGVIVYDIMRKSYIKVYWLTAEAVKNVITILKSHSISSFMYELKDGVLISYYESLEQKPLYDFAEVRKARYNSIFYQTEDLTDVSHEHIIYFTLVDTYERIKPVYDELRKYPALTRL